VAEGQPLRGVVVLVVEDDEALLEAIAFLIRDALGANVIPVASSVEALQIIDSGAHVDLVFADIIMPQMDGLTLARLIRDRLPALPIVLCTGLSAAVDSATENGAIPLIKPYSLQQLEAVFTEQLRIEYRRTAEHIPAA
jgi:CheY-like chemotaxis protein